MTPGTLASSRKRSADRTTPHNGTRITFGSLALKDPPLLNLRPLNPLLQGPRINQVAHHSIPGTRLMVGHQGVSPMLDPRRVGAVCYDGYWRRTYLVLGRDGVTGDWRVEWENGRLGQIAAGWWGRGDRVLRVGGWGGPVVEQLELFTAGPRGVA